MGDWNMFVVIIAKFYLTPSKKKLQFIATFSKHGCCTWANFNEWIPVLLSWVRHHHSSFCVTIPPHSTHSSRPFPASPSFLWIFQFIFYLVFTSFHCLSGQVENKNFFSRFFQFSPLLWIFSRLLFFLAFLKDAFELWLERKNNKKL